MKIIDLHMITISKLSSKVINIISWFFFPEFSGEE